jgi:hypothetical protein
MIFNSFLLFAIGDGIFIYGMHEFQENGAFGAWFYTYKGERYPLPSALRPWINQYLADFSKCCNSDKPAVDGNGQKPTFFTLLRAIFGYQAKPTRLEIICYCCYWGLVMMIVGYKASKGTLWGKKEEEEELPPAKIMETSSDEEGAPAEAGAEGDAAKPATPAKAAKEEKEELFSSLAARILLRLTAGCTKPQAEPLQEVQAEQPAGEGDADAAARGEGVAAQAQETVEVPLAK